MNFDFILGQYVTNNTKWKKTKDMYGIKFSNDPRTIDEINDWNVEEDINRFYMDFWRNSKFQIPRRYVEFPSEGSATQWIEIDNCCNCKDARCTSYVELYESQNP